MELRGAWYRALCDGLLAAMGEGRGGLGIGTMAVFWFPERAVSSM